MKAETKKKIRSLEGFFHLQDQSQKPDDVGRKETPSPHPPLKSQNSPSANLPLKKRPQFYLCQSPNLGCKNTPRGSLLHAASHARVVRLY